MNMNYNGISWLVLIFFLGREGICGPMSQTTLYGPQDKVTLLNITTIKKEIYNSERAWLVEFFSSWCGHCIAFAPLWKQFALDVSEWRRVVTIAAIDCADEKNIPTCREYEIMGYPSILYFEPQAEEHLKEGDMISSVYKGKLFKKQEVMGSMRRQLIESLMPDFPSLLSPKTPTSLAKIKENEELWKDWDRKGDVELLLCIFESPNSFVGKEVALSFSGVTNIRVFFFNEKGDLYSNLELSGWPAAATLTRDGKVKILELATNKDLLHSITDDVKLQFVPIYHMPNEAPKEFDRVNGFENEDLTSLVKKEEKVFPFVHYEDLIHAVRNLLKFEIGLLNKLGGTKLDTLRSFLRILRDYFPADKREMSTFLHKIYDFTVAKTTITSVEWLGKLDTLENDLNPFDADMSEWSGCRGSETKYRGYPCGLWVLFHTLTVVAYEKEEGGDASVIPAIHGFVTEFFGCKECANHFDAMVKKEGALDLSGTREQVVWLWRAHNQVNLRLRGGPSEDPKYPKIEFPSETNCPSCYESNEFVESKVFEFLISHYSKPKRVTKPSRIGRSLEYSDGEKSRELGFFTAMDMGLGLCIYASVAILLLIGFLHFTRKGKLGSWKRTCLKTKALLPTC